MPTFNSILVANRGEIACRILRTAQALGYRTVTVYSEADSDSPHLQLADQALCIGPAAASQSYLNIPAIISAAQRSGAQAIHPGYGFLSENPALAEACATAGLQFIGPGIDALRLMGNKRLAKTAMLAAGVPCIPGYSGAEQDDARLLTEAQSIGFPLMIKASAGGGGRGMRLVTDLNALPEQLRSAHNEALAAFGSDELILERALINPRHVEVQIFGDQHGNLIHLGERDCSIQRRHQKVIEEAPCPILSAEQREAMGTAAIKAAASVGYYGAGTVEFMLDAAGDFYFLEMNTRLQVEHPVTEMITGLDLVAWQFEVAEGRELPLQQHQIQLQGHAIEARLYAEDPSQQFLPQSGQVLHWQPAQLPGVRIDHGIQSGQTISPHYDPMLAKIIAHGSSREQARTRLIQALEQSLLIGVQSNQQFLLELLQAPAFARADTSTAFIDQHCQQLPALQAPVLDIDALSIAAVLWYMNEPHRALPAQQPADLHGWSNGAPIPAVCRLRHAGQLHSLRLTPKPGTGGLHLQVSHADQHREIVFVALSPLQLTLELDGVRQQRSWYRRGHCLWLVERGVTQLFEDCSHLPIGRSQSQSGDSVSAPMDGCLVSLQAQAGEQVSQGQLLGIMEAMKMEHPLRAPRDGRIDAITASVGQQLSRRQVVIKLLPLGSSE
ncbi:MAG: acetyl/propionyl/methylcrotonyl-CoA carboxylase subunit alpha [Pseudomonas sp.]